MKASARQGRRRSRLLGALQLLALALAALLATGNARVDAQIHIGLDEDEKRALEIGYRAGRTVYSLAKAMDRITPEDEYYLGRAVAARLLTIYEPWDDAAAARYVERVGHSLALASESPEVYAGYTFVLLDSDEINAFACPGAIVFITRGMLQLATDEDTLAAVLAHEIAHVQRHHGRRLIEEKRWKKFWAVAGTGAVGSLGGKVVSKLALALGGMAESLFVSLHTKGYGKKLEAEADADAVAMLDRTGYDPHALATLLTVMDAGLDPKRKDFAKTHPKPGKRLDSLKRALREHPPRPIPEVRRQRFRSALGGSPAEVPAGGLAAGAAVD